jgi:Domain of unknown function (DUF4337)
MKAHEAFERFEDVAERPGTTDGSASGLAREAAVVVAVLAALLATSTFLSNEAVKEVITGETRAADTSARLEANDVKATIADASSTLLRVTGTGNPKEAQGAAKAEALNRRVTRELAPIDRRLSANIKKHAMQRDQANDRHVIYELSEVALQIGIVLAGISILVRRRWLLTGGGLVGIAGTVLLVIGLAY